MKNAAIVNVEGKSSTRVVSFPEGVSLRGGSFVRVAFEKNGNYVGKLLTNTMVLNEGAYSELCEYINPCGKEIEICAIAEVQRYDKPFEVVETNLPERFLEGPIEKHYGNVGEPAGFKDKLGIDLFVGDVVNLFDADGEYIGKRFVVKDEGGEAFVMGIKSACIRPGGKTGMGFDFHLYKRHERVLDGEDYGGVRMVRKEWAG